METIEVVIAADGSLSYTVKGVKGSGCKALTKLIDNLGTVTDTKKTSEFCALPVGQTQKQGGA